MILYTKKYIHGKNNFVEVIKNSVRSENNFVKLSKQLCKAWWDSWHRKQL